MVKKESVSVSRLRVATDPESIPYADSDAIPEGKRPAPFQARALQAMELALAVKSREYNVFLAGEGNLGRTYFLRDVLRPVAAKAKVPPDIVYVYNFEDPDKPPALTLPAGRGRKLKHAMAKAVENIRRDIPARFEQDAHFKKHETLHKRFQAQRDALIGEMEERASKKGFSLDMDEHGGLVLSPLVEGKILGHEDFDRLDKAERTRLKSLGSDLMADMTGMLRKISREEQGLRKREKDLRRQTALGVVDQHLNPVASAFKGNRRLSAYFRKVREDMAEHVEEFLPKEAPPLLPGQEGPQIPPEDYFFRYEINLVVDNSDTRGAPVVIEEHPTCYNLMGSIEREAELGALYTDFTLIKAGALHRARGGYLILRAEDVLANPHAWEALLRALRTGVVKIEDMADPEPVRSRTIEPEPVDLDVRVALVGTDELYEILLYHDERFGKYFKVQAQLTHTVERNAANVRAYLQVLGRVVREASLPPFDREALAALVDLGSRLAEDNQELSLAFSLLRERMIEAAALARKSKKKVVGAGHLRRAVAAREFRANLFEEEFMRDYDREIIKVATSGQAVGRANGLAVTMYGSHEFGLPHQIACNVGVGHGGILDLEREAQLGGPIHTKGMMIIKSYLVGHFARTKPIVLTGSLCFEQSYAGVEGDSASGAELAALLSALAEVPIDLSHAFTGAVSQSGAVMAVGGVNRKIEGFFEVCRRRGLTGDQGVLLPRDNLANLMLKEEVVEAVEQGLFHIHPVRTIEEAMEILTGMPAGTRRATGDFPPGTLYRLVQTALARFAELAEKWHGGKA